MSTTPPTLNTASAREMLAAARERQASPTSAPVEATEPAAVATPEPVREAVAAPPAPAPVPAPTPAPAPAPAKLTMAGLLDPIRSDIARALPKRVDSERFIEAALIELRSLDLSDISSKEIRRGVMRLAHLGLEPGLAQLVNLFPQKNKARQCTELVPRPTYRGVIELARRSGEVRTVIAKVIYAEEQFETWVDDAGEHLKHRPVLAPQSPMIGAYAYATGNDGRLLAMVTLSVADIEARRAYSRRANAGAWVEHYEAMARKTAILALAPFLPLSPEQAGIFEAPDASPVFEAPGAGDGAPDMPQATSPAPEPAPAATDASSGSAAASGTRSQRRAPVPA